MQYSHHTANTQSGFSIIEIMLAAALGLMAISAVLMVSLGDQSLGTDSEINAEALQRANALSEETQAKARFQFNSIATSSTTKCVGSLCYTETVDIPASYSTQCKQRIETKVTWTGDRNRAQQVSMSSDVVNLSEMIALAGTCDTSPPTRSWRFPATFASGNFNPGKPTGIDVLQRTAYITGDKSPYLFIASTSYVTLGQSSGLFVNTGSFNAKDPLNDIRVAKAGNGKTYAYVAAHTPTKQFRVYDVTSINLPVEVASTSLAGVSGSFPQGWRIFYYDKKVYIVVRETAGNELHIFDVSRPWIPSSMTEYGTGFSLNRTVESLVVTKRVVAGVDRYYAFMATDKNSAELTVLDVTNPAAVVELTGSNQDLAGNQDGASVYLLQNKLYFGRTSSSGSDLYVYDASQPQTGLTLLQQQDIGTGVVGIVTSGQFIFLATEKTNNEFQVYSATTTNPQLISTFNFPNLVENGLRYENNWVYVTSQANDALRIIYSP